MWSKAVGQPQPRLLLLPALSFRLPVQPGWVAEVLPSP